MKKQIFVINKETIKKEIFDYIDTEFANYSNFNDFYKSIIIDDVIEVVGTKTLYDYIQVYENKVAEITKNPVGVITGFLKAVNMLTGEPLYNYKIETKIKDDKLMFFYVNWLRKDNKKDYYSYKLEHNINNFIDLLKKEENINTLAEKDIINLLKLLTENVYEYIQVQIDEEKEVTPETMIKETLFILTDMEANRIIPKILKEEEKVEDSKK
ncbi:MAG: hypothetical protein ACLT40_00685 [Fusobacterium sp.]